MPLNHSSKYAELTDEQFIIIGKIVVEFSNMEYLLGVLASRLLITPEFLGRTFTNKIIASALQEIITNALDVHKRRYKSNIITLKQSEQIKKLNDRISKVRALRNTFAHYCWCRSNDNEIFGTKLSGKVPKDKKFNKEAKVVSKKELNNTYLEAYSIVEELINIIEELPEIEEDENLLQKIKFKVVKELLPDGRSETQGTKNKKDN